MAHVIDKRENFSRLLVLVFTAYLHINTKNLLLDCGLVLLCSTFRINHGSEKVYKRL